MKPPLGRAVAPVIAILALGSAFAQTTPSAPAGAPAPAAATLLYGEPISAEWASAAIAAAEAEAKRNGWFMAIAVADPGGHLVQFRRMDNTQVGSINIAIGKARTAAQFRRPTKVFQDMLAQGSAFTYVLGLEGATVVQGGMPLVRDDKIVGAIGASGSSGDNDTQTALAAARALASLSR